MLLKVIKVHREMQSLIKILLVEPVVDLGEPKFP